MKPFRANIMIMLKGLPFYPFFTMKILCIIAPYLGDRVKTKMIMS